MNQDKQEERAENYMRLKDVGDVRDLTPQEEKIKEFMKEWETTLSIIPMSEKTLIMLLNSLELDLTNLLDNWISVRKKLPKENIDLIFIKKDGFWYKGFYDKGLWYYENGVFVKDIPTHYFIPQPPKEEK